jgi:ferredoxin
VVTITNPEPDLYIRTSNKSKYIVEYHRDACIGAASCAAIAPFTFEMDEENKAVFVKDDKDSDDGRDNNGNNEEKNNERDEDDIILASAQSCPVFAIAIKDKETGEQIFPPVE